MNDSDTEFIAPEEIEFTDNRDNASVLKPELNDHVFEEGTTHTKELETNKKRKNPEENTRSYGNAAFLHILERMVFLKKLLILMF